jgi:signal transduction histidine kinase
MVTSPRSGLLGEQEWVEISVRDEGPGIEASHLPRIFDPFYRVDTRLSREVNGLGIGLAICKRIIELHGGVIWVESTVGAGSTFHIRLPRGGPPATSA